MGDPQGTIGREGTRRPTPLNNLAVVKHNYILGVVYPKVSDPESFTFEINETRDLLEDI